MKKLKVNKRYGNWYYETYQDYDMEFKIYKVWNNKEKYQVSSYSDMLALVKEPTKELRENFERVMG